MMVTTVSTSRLKALDFFSPSRAVVESARLLAQAAIADLDRFESVEVDFSGLRGISSSYFNAFFGDVGRVLGSTVLRTRLHCRYETKGQGDLAGRSLDAVLRSLDGPATQTA